MHNQSHQEAKKYRLADYFDQWWDIYKQKPKDYITPEQYKAVNALRLCRTEALGIDHYVCEECGEITQVYHSCKNRFCPTCSWQDTLKWAERVKGKMLNLSHRHVVMTLPHGLNSLIKRNRKPLLDLLLRSSSETLKDWMLHKHKLQPGIISVLHTFGETKEFHCHVHMIVSWGGIEKETGLLKEIKGDYVNYNFLKQKFQAKYEDGLIALYDKGVLLHGFENRQSFLRFIKKINAKRWILHLEPSMQIPTQVIRYIGRYSKRACISEYKITRIEGRAIAFMYKDNKHKDINGKPIERELELDYEEFFPRLLQHVPLKHYRIVRYYGSYSNKGRIPEEYYYKDEKKEETEQEKDDKEAEEVDYLMCPHCKIRKEYLYTSIKKMYKGQQNVFRRRNLIKNEFSDDDVA